MDVEGPDDPRCEEQAPAPVLQAVDNRRIIFAGNGRISLFSNPVIEREIVSESGTWDNETAFAEMEESFKSAILWPNFFDKPRDPA